MYVLGNVLPSWFILGLFLVSSHVRTRFLHPSYRSISPRQLRSAITSPGLLGAHYTSSIVTSFILCLFIALLYRSLDGVIPEAFIYVYISYNITWVSPLAVVDRASDWVLGVPSL